MSQARKERTLPCTSCKERHLRCDPHLPCRSCKKSGIQCIRSTKPFRFKRTSKSSANFAFDSGQTWLATTTTNELPIVNVTKDVARQSAKASASKERPNGTDAHDQTFDSLEADEAPNEAASVHDLFSASPTRSRGQTIRSPEDHNAGNEEIHHIVPGIGDQMNTPIANVPGMHVSPLSSHHHPPLPAHGLIPASPEMIITGNDRASSSGLQSEFLSPTYSNNLLGSTKSFRDLQSTQYAFPSPYYVSPDALHGLPEKVTTEAYVNLQESCLIKHFVKNLAHAFDTTDRDRHFQHVVPQRAIFCPVLLYAIYTASAAHLTRQSLHQNPGKPFEFEGVPLPELSENSAVQYHNICITYLMEILNDPKQTINQDALIAATILRFHEQIDTSLTGWDPETYLSVLRGVIETQQNASFFSLATIQGPPMERNLYAAVHPSLAHSACLIALRQEIWSVLLYRRPFRFPLCPDNEYTNFTEDVDDYVWTNRILIWAADVCCFCFGGGVSGAAAPPDTARTPTLAAPDGASRIERWKTLYSFLQRWDSLQPACFKPLYYREPDAAGGRVFPEEWHTNECQVLALQHVELSRMLLAAYDPSLHRIGLGAASSMLALEERLRRSTLRLCGLAMSDVNDQAAMVTAAVGISMCGEYFRETREQKAIEDFLQVLEREHAWPVRTVMRALRDAWAVRESGYLHGREADG